MIVCDPSAPGMNGTYYHRPYIESVEGQRHGYMTKHGVAWTRNTTHPDDPKCPECGRQEQE
jgi:hypothetical protein